MNFASFLIQVCLERFTDDIGRPVNEMRTIVQEAGEYRGALRTATHEEKHQQNVYHIVAPRHLP